MDAIKFINEKTRMCESFGTTCIGCPMYSDIKKTKYECWMFVITHAEQAVAIVKKWSNEHPVITNGKKFREVFGFTFPVDSMTVSGIYANWVNKEYKEPKGEE